MCMTSFQSPAGATYSLGQSLMNLRRNMPLPMNRKNGWALLRSRLEHTRAGGTTGNSPAFQRRVPDPKCVSPEGTAEGGTFADENLWRQTGRPFGTWVLFSRYPALKRRAISVDPSGIIRSKSIIGTMSHKNGWAILRAGRQRQLRNVNRHLKVQQLSKAVSRRLATALQDGKRERTVHGFNATNLNGPGD